jgi:hypothetical protein
MIRGIDHLVIACADPDDAARELEAAVGLASTGGGRHERFGTRNRIAWLADGSYVELIGIDDASLIATSPVGRAVRRQLDAHGAGLATYALVVDDIQSTVAGLRGAGSPIGLPQHGTRRRDDGELVEWWTAFPDTDLGPATVPFLIEHVEAGAEWGRDALEARAAFVHPIGSAVRLLRLAVAVDDPPAAAGELARVLGVATRAVGDLAIVTVGPHEIRFRPTHEMPVPAVVRLAADVPTPRTAELLGMRFDVQPTPARVAPAATSGTG